jgi:hypothetical protein
MSRVYHVLPGKKGDPIFGYKTPVWPRDYYEVASVSSDNIEEAFRLTNSIEFNWWENAEVTALFSGGGCRSTSVGDVVEVNGTFHLCASSGWTVLEKDFNDIAK